MPIRITGLNSGLDTESIISALVSSYNYKTQKYKKAQTKISWKQDAWKELNTKIYSLYKNVGNLKLSSAYNLKSANVSDTTKVSVKAGSNSVNGSYSVQVTSLAKAGYLTGGRLAAGTTGNTKLEGLGYTGGDGKISVTVGNKTTDITISKDSTVQQVVNQLKEAGVNASYDATNHRIFVSAKETGAANDFSLTGSDENGALILNTLGLSVASDANIAEYLELVEGYSAMTEADMKTIVEGKDAAVTANKNFAKANGYYADAISYAKAVESINAVKSGDEDEFELLKTLITSDSLTDQYVKDGKIYKKDSESGKYIYTDANGVKQEEVSEADIKDSSKGFVSASSKLEDLKRKYFAKKDEKGNTVQDKEGKNEIDETAAAAFKNNLSTVKNIEAKAKDAEKVEVTIAGSDVSVDLKELLEKTKNYAKVADFEAAETRVTAVNAEIAANDAILAANPKLTAGMKDEEVTAFYNKVQYVMSIRKKDADGNVILDAQGKPTFNIPVSTGATRVNGSDAKIYVNGAEYEGTSNTFSINGLTITATGVTKTEAEMQAALANGTADTDAVNVTVNTDVQGLYDKVKDFLSQYNALINEMTALYNADSAKGYEPLTDEERDQMSDTEIEKWEEKIKSSLLRRDSTLSDLLNCMTNAMSKGVEVDGKTYYLSSFGIKTLGILNAQKNQHNAYHIDGDEDDVNTSGNTDRLMAAITQDPDTVVEFMQKLSDNLYNAVHERMKSTRLSSIYTVYNDREMASEYSDYTSLITKWQNRLEQQEEYYYNKFAAMESALAKINSQTSSLSGLFGM